MDTRKTLRTHYTTLRSQLSPQTCIDHNNAVTQYILNSAIFQKSQNIAFYFAVNGEISLQSLLDISLQQQKCCYLPCLSGHNQHLEFRKFLANDTLQKNKFGILEPLTAAPLIAADKLDMVLVPLVAWDMHGHRLGMGAGFYDRTFAFKLEQKTEKIESWLIGVAHQCQQHPGLNQMPWDVGLDAVVTEIAFHHF